uniref:peptidyl-tRNA hydrolase n=1 Tax=Leptobrachium leishanense TaxID=445787 RepID=A0A8C5PWI6_9ANUR
METSEQESSDTTEGTMTICGDNQNFYKMFFCGEYGAADGRGKVAAQVGHGAKKVVFQGSNMAHLLELQALDISMNLPTYVVQDAGRTQIGTGSYTVLAIMGEEDFVNLVTGKLKLLN